MYLVIAFRPFIAYDAVEPFDTSLSLDKRRAWWDKFQYTTSSGGWRDQELCTRLYSRLSHNPGTKTWVQQLPASVRRSWRQLSDRFYKEFCRSMESPVERYLCLKQESRETPQTFLWRLNAPATKANVDFHSTSVLPPTCESIPQEPPGPGTPAEPAGTDELEDVLKQVEEMEQGMRQRALRASQALGHRPRRYSPWGFGGICRRGNSRNSRTLDSGLRRPTVGRGRRLGLRISVRRGKDEAYDGLVDPEEVFRAEVPGSWNDRNGRPQGRPDSRGSGHSGTPRPSVLCLVCNKLGHTRERCCQLHPAGECEVIKASKDAAQRGQLQGLPEQVLQKLRPEATPADPVRDEPKPRQTCCAYAYVSLNEPQCMSIVSTPNPEPGSVYTSHVAPEEDELSFELQPGARRGWWEANSWDDSSCSVAFVHGSVFHHRILLMLDSGASTSIISLDLARRLKLKVEPRGELLLNGEDQSHEQVPSQDNTRASSGLHLRCLGREHRSRYRRPPGDEFHGRRWSPVLVHPDPDLESMDVWVSRGDRWVTLHEASPGRHSGGKRLPEAGPIRQTGILGLREHPVHRGGTPPGRRSPGTRAECTAHGGPPDVPNPNSRPQADLGDLGRRTPSP
ncbi:LOW QUALITY PROTEIN: hypothetical protein PHMEG_00020919 [Phytophthora megakarya]|uniref:Peptidase A2 domain-containing protein n=1 Tax=Phytophthora megakarya TaxID=4795 RepID=A0A225VNV7_9STRA|nr:LOW QUALITY PROTEIN: hypothetical protein PHMEG_00020919 [Phytophthora megakarya]